MSIHPWLNKQSFLLIPLVIATNFCFALVTPPVHAMPLSQTEIDQKIQAIPQWQQSAQTIKRTFKFKNFVEAIAFVNQLVEPSEAAGHHPDLTISYNQVRVSLTSHDAGGLTDKDFALAKIISNLAP
ncbi:MAG: pterin-4a-carbinolamine dehydratase [Cyanobacteriota bacterium]|jgi:4a-hydroxytetrahydrobiopterin dehydratase